ncbi:hypothetical protein PC123_g15276, partial [Phytophthora cactorum]
GVAVWLYEYVNVEYRDGYEAMKAAAAGGDAELTRYLEEKLDMAYDVWMPEAAANGHLEMITWLYEQEFDEMWFDRGVLLAAAEKGQPAVWLHETRSEGCTTAAMDGAANEGHLEAVKWLHLNRSEGCTSAAMDGAAASGALEVVTWLHRNWSEGCTTAAMDGAARVGDLRMIRWLHEHRSEGCTSKAMDNATVGDHFEAALLLHKFRSEGCTRVSVSVASFVPEISEWVREHYPAL